MAGNLDIKKETAESQIAKLVSDADTFLTDMETEYETLSTTLSKSQGDFIDALKVQLTAELAILQEASTFFKTLLDMLQAAKGDFETVDTTYSDTKVG